MGIELWCEDYRSERRASGADGEEQLQGARDRSAAREKEERRFGEREEGVEAAATE